MAGVLAGRFVPVKVREVGGVVMRTTGDEEAIIMAEGSVPPSQLLSQVGSVKVPVALSTH